jgi:alkaline phosphatase D
MNITSKQTSIGRRPVTLMLAASVFLLAFQVSGQHDYKASRKHIRSGNYDKALKVLNARIAKFPDDSEWHYQLAITRGLKGEKVEALKALMKAIELGVHPGRVTADSYDLLKPLSNLPEVRKLLESQKNVPIQGPMLGALKPDSASIWLRTFGSAEVKVLLADEKGKLMQTTTPVNTAAGSDFTKVIRVDNLQPATTYKYSVQVNGIPEQPEFEHTFRTASSGKSKFTLAFGGGAGYVTKHEYMWETIASFNPNALLLLGDNMYSDDPDSSQMQKFCYYRRQSPPQFRRLVSTTPVYSIWDDHDFGTNDCSGGPEIDVPNWKRPVWEVFRQNWVNPGYAGGTAQPGCWYDFHISDVHFIMLDGRYYRHRPGKTMLGPAQKEWLKKTVKASRATFKVLCSPVPWDYRTKGDSKDTWNGFKEERTEIFDFLANNKIGGVLLISADRHRSDAWEIERPNGYALYEFNSSRLTNNHVHGTRPAAIFSYNKKQSFGLVEFDTSLEDPTVKYTVVNIEGEKIHSLPLKRSQLE